MTETDKKQKMCFNCKSYPCGYYKMTNCVVCICWELAEIQTNDNMFGSDTFKNIMDIFSQKKK